MSDLELRQIIDRSSGRPKEILQAYDKFSRLNAPGKMLTCMREAIAESLTFFQQGLEIKDLQVLAKWASAWSHYKDMLIEFMMGSATQLLKQGLMRDCLLMTQDVEVMNNYALSALTNNQPARLLGLVDAGFKPAFDAYSIKEFLNVVKEVDQTKREHFDLFLDAFLEVYPTSKLFTYEHLTAMLGRHMGCKGSTAAGYQKFKNDLWPRVAPLVGVEPTRENMHVVLQQAACEYSAPKTVSWLKHTGDSCKVTPLFLLDKATSFGFDFRKFGENFNPYEQGNEAFDVFPSAMFKAPLYFELIAGNRMREDFMYNTLPMVLDDLEGHLDNTQYQGIRTQAEGMELSALELSKLSLSDKAALVHMMIKDESRFEGQILGAGNIITRFLFQQDLESYYDAAGFEHLFIKDVFKVVGGKPLEEILRDKAQLQVSSSTDNMVKQAIGTFDECLMTYGENITTLTAYLEMLDVNEKQARNLVSSLASNPASPHTEADELMRLISWKNEQVSEGALATDLGL
jgi:hypothetical protein